MMGATCCFAGISVFRLSNDTSPRLLRFHFFLFVPSAGSLAQVTFNPLPTRVIGQDSVQVKTLSPNLVEGREFFAPGGVALDTSTNPPALYVSDTRNNRVLAFHNATSFTNGQTADLVLGQPDLATTLAAGPSSSGTATTGLTLPIGVAVDAHGNVYVVDAGNNRILRFPTPFAQSGTPMADIAIGQPSFATNGANQGGVSASALAFTTTTAVLEAFITFDSAGNLWVSDAGNNRVLRFNANVLGAQASSGPAADIVLGQFNFVNNTYNPPVVNPLTSTEYVHNAYRHSVRCRRPVVRLGIDLRHGGANSDVDAAIFHRAVRGAPVGRGYGDESCSSGH